MTGAAGTRRGAWLEDLTWPEAKRWIDDGAPVVIPIGAAAKEHGHHLPMCTDLLTARHLGEAVARALPVLVAPVIDFGYYPAFRHYPGSQHLRAETFMALVSDIVDGFIADGVQHLALINTGVSTVAPLQIVAREIRERHGVRIMTADIERLGRGADARFEQQLGGHGDEHETAVMLAIAPERVHMERAVTDYGHMREVPGTVFQGPVVFGPDPQSGVDYSATGVRGDPTLATAEKGRVAVQAMVDDLIDGLRTLFGPALAQGTTRPPG